MNCSPAVVDGVVYTGASGDPGGLFAVDADTGEEIWSFETAGYVTSAPVVSDGVLYVGTWGRRFYAVDVADGSEIWSADVGHRMGSSSPVLAGDAVVVGTHGDGPLVVSGPEDEEEFEAPAVLALDAGTGEERWRYDGFGEREAITSSPASADGRVFVGGDDGVLYALDAETGTVDWERAVGGHPDSSPAVVDGVVYHGTRDERGDTASRLLALDAGTGDTVWSYGVADVSLRNSSAVADGTVYLAASTTTACPAVADGDGSCTSTSSGTLYAVDAESGAERWTVSVGTDTRPSPGVADGTVYVGCAGGVTAVSTDGSRNWRVDFGEYVDSSPAVAGGRLFVGCSDGLLYAIAGT